MGDPIVPLRQGGDASPAAGRPRPYEPKMPNDIARFAYFPTPLPVLPLAGLT